MRTSAGRELRVAPFEIWQASRQAGRDPHVRTRPVSQVDSYCVFGVSDPTVEPLDDRFQKLRLPEIVLDRRIETRVPLRDGE